MFECAEQMLVQLIPYIPGFIGIYLIFDFTNGLFFRR